MAAALRFVPYLGTIIAMTLPASVAFLQSDGWTRTLGTLVLFWIAALIAYVLDPIVNGTRTATSPFALLLAAFFWTWLWGPVGLLLSTPITLCLAAAGKHVPGMESLAILLAAEPAPQPEGRIRKRKLRRGHADHDLAAGLR
jgi:predicted PurR-regulated permease PerM